MNHKDKIAYCPKHANVDKVVEALQEIYDSQYNRKYGGSTWAGWERRIMKVAGEALATLEPQEPVDSHNDPDTPPRDEEGADIHPIGEDGTQ